MGWGRNLIKEHNQVPPVGSHFVYDNREFIGGFFFLTIGIPLKVNISIEV